MLEQTGKILLKSFFSVIAQLLQNMTCYQLFFPPANAVGIGDEVVIAVWKGDFPWPGLLYFEHAESGNCNPHI